MVTAGRCGPSFCLRLLGAVCLGKADDEAAGIWDEDEDEAALALGDCSGWFVA